MSFSIMESRRRRKRARQNYDGPMNYTTVPASIPFRRGRYSSMKSLSNGKTIHKHVRTTILGAILVNTGTGGSQNFKLNDVPNYTEYTSLYDSYKIYGIKVKFFYGLTQNGTSSPNNIGRLAVAIDYNDDTVPGSENVVLEYANCKTWRLDNLDGYARVYIKPKISSMVYKTAITTGYESTIPKWIDTSNPDIPHFGLKYWISANTTNTYEFKLYCTYYMLMKSTK